MFVIVITPLLQIIVHYSYRRLQSYHDFNYVKLLFCNKFALFLYYLYVVCMLFA